MHNSSHPHELSIEGGAAPVVSLEQTTTDFAEGLADVIQLPSATARTEAARLDRTATLREMYGDTNEHNLSRHLGGAAVCDDNLSRATEQAFRP